MPFEQIATNTTDGVMTITLNRPERLNAWTAQMGRELIEAYTAPVSVALARRMMWTMLGADHPMQAHRADSRGMPARGTSADAGEGVTAFLEKRPARFPDKVSDGLPQILPDWTRQEFV
jgi:enoyl-CoA hydratase/carnithine racemase